MKTFNTEGPMVPARHYCIPPLSRINLEEVLELIEHMRYFVLHAPRQTGKTSTLLALANTINATGQYRCVYANFEVGQMAREDVGQAIRTILNQLGLRARRTLGDTFVKSAQASVTAENEPGSALNEMLTLWSESDDRPLVLLIDEIDTLVGDSLISVLRQLRAGYDQRPEGFPQSIVLCGVRDVRGCRILTRSRGTDVTGGSTFNIKAKSLRLGDFTKCETRSLLGQHTEETGQEFESDAVERVWDLTLGQPWLTNALVRQACFDDRAGRDRSRPIGLAAIDQAKETLILERVTHLDQLASQLREERVRRVILPMLAGSDDWDYSHRDLEYVRDLGLVAASGPVRMANPIYAEVIPRELTAAQESGLEGMVSPTWYAKDDGSLDLTTRMAAFQDYFRKHSEAWVKRYGHREAGPHLVLHAYLHRVVYSGGRITREYAVARRRTDLVVEWSRPGGTLQSNPSTHVIE